MSQSELNSYVIGAYDEFGDDVYAAHRDYVYFGMTNSNLEGRLNTRINECIHKIKFRGMYLQHNAIRESGDFVDKGQILEYKENDLWQTAQSLRNTFYSDGNIELRFHIAIGNKSGVATQISKMVHASFADVFAISKSDLDYRHKTWFCQDWFVYTVDYAYFYPRWFTVNLRIPNWDISSQSAVVMIEVEEHDDGDLENYESNVQSTYMNNFKFDASSDVSDDLGSAYLNYMDPIIIGEETRNGVAGYNVKTFSTGVVDMMILPIFE